LGIWDREEGANSALTCHYPFCAGLFSVVTGIHSLIMFMGTELVRLVFQQCHGTQETTLDLWLPLFKRQEEQWA